MRKVLTVLLTALLTSCSTIEVSELPPMPAPSSMRGFKSVEQALATKFTPEALDAIKQIPVIYGQMYVPFVTGVNIWSDIAGILLFNGASRQVIFSRHHMECISALPSLIHEYVHHIDDMDRDGLLDLIDHEEFETAFAFLAKDERFKHKHESISYCADWPITNIFGIGYLSEEIAYTASWLIRDGGPDYMWAVFRKILIRPTVQNPEEQK